MLASRAESFLLASTINALVGQRIVRKICETCTESYVPPPAIVAEIKKELGSLFSPDLEKQGVKIHKGKGCTACGGSGYLGRVGIYEVMPVTDKIAQLVLQHSDVNALEKQAVAEGMITMKQDGYLKVLSGLSTVEEVIRVAQE